MRLLTTITLLLVSSFGFAQDAFFSQYWNAPVQSNVAAIGSIPYLQTGVHYRNQWPSALNPYTTYEAHLSYPLLRQGPPDPQWGAIGVEILNDLSGPGGTIHQTQFRSIFNYKTPLNHKYYVSFGGAISGIWNQVKTEGLSTGLQYSGGLYQPTLPTGETLDKNFGHAFAVDGGLELYERRKNGSKNWYLSLSGYNLNRYKANLFTSQSSIPMRVSMTGGFLMVENNYIKISPSFRYQFQQGNHITTLGSVVYYKSTDRRRRDSPQTLFGGGLFSRLGKDIILTAETKQENFSAGLSFDFNANKYSTRPGGTIELFLTYNVTKKPTIPKNKNRTKSIEKKPSVKNIDSSLHAQQKPILKTDSIATDSSEMLLRNALDRDLNSDNHYSTMVEFKILNDSVNVLALGSEIIIKNLEDSHENKFYITYNRDSTAFMSYLKKDTKYAVTVKKEGFYNKTLMFSTGKRDTIEIPSKLKLIVLGEVIVLNKIHFKSGFAVLQESSIPELESLVEFLLEYPTIKAEISGHTDDAGPDDYNLQLSQYRAQVIVTYLENQGIDNGRLKAIGYGETQPIKPNTSEENRAANRRVELKIIGK